MTANEKKFVNMVANYDEKLVEARQYIKENFGVNSIYNEDDNSLVLSTDNVNESLQLMAAKEHLENVFGKDMLNLNI